MFQVSGIIRYYPRWCIAWLKWDDDLLPYYRALVPKAKYVQPPMRAAHVSIVRPFEEVPDRSAWGRHEGDSIVIDYEPGVHTDGTYFWLDCWSDEIGYIRRSVGLPTFRENDGWSDYSCYHITIGNTKNGY